MTTYDNAPPPADWHTDPRPDPLAPPKPEPLDLPKLCVLGEN